MSSMLACVTTFMSSTACSRMKKMNMRVSKLYASSERLVKQMMAVLVYTASRPMPSISWPHMPIDSAGVGNGRRWL